MGIFYQTTGKAQIREERNVNIQNALVWSLKIGMDIKSSKFIILGVIISCLIVAIPLSIFGMTLITEKIDLLPENQWGLVITDTTDSTTDRCLTIRNSTYSPTITMDCKTGLIVAQNYLLTKNVYLKDIDGNQWKLEVHPDGTLAVHCSKFANGTLCFDEVSRTVPSP